MKYIRSRKVKKEKGVRMGKKKTEKKEKGRKLQRIFFRENKRERRKKTRLRYE